MTQLSDRHSDVLIERDFAGRSYEELAAEIWELAAKSAGAVRISLDGELPDGKLDRGILLDVFEETAESPRRLVVWRDQQLTDGGRFGNVASYLRRWNEEMATLRGLLFPGRRSLEWSMSPALGGYPPPAQEYTARVRFLEAGKDP